SAFLSHHPAPTELYPLSLHDALPISGEAVQAQFPILFFFIIVSSMNLPRNLIEAHWFEVAATLNPVSYMIEGLRSLVIVGWDARSEEHTSELQSLTNLVCRLLLEKKK